MKLNTGAAASHAKAPKYPTKRTVNLAQRESHSRSTLSSPWARHHPAPVASAWPTGVLRQLDRQRDAEQAYNAAHSQYTAMQAAPVRL